MEIIVKEYFYEKILILIDDGHSIYEIALLLNAHNKLILKSIGKGRAFLKLDSNNQKFFLKINANHPSPLMAEIEFRKFNILTGRGGSVFYTVKYPETLEKWEINLPAALKEELNEKKQNAANSPEKTSFLPGASEASDGLIMREEDEDDFFETESKKAEWKKFLQSSEDEKETTNQIIKDYLDGIPVDAICLNHKVSSLSLLNLIDEHYLPDEITLTMVENRVRRLVIIGAGRQYIEWRFSHINGRRLKLMMLETPKPKEEKTFIVAEEKDQAEPAIIKKKNKIPAKTGAFIIKDYRTGIRPDKIAKKYRFPLQYVLNLLAASGSYKWYYEKNVMDEKERNAALVNYYKRGWDMAHLKYEFKISYGQAKKILETNGFIIKDETDNLPVIKRSKVDLVVDYFKKGKSIFDIAERLVMTPERVEYLLRKKGFLEEGDLT